MSQLDGGSTGVNHLYSDVNRSRVSRVGLVAGASRWSQVFDLNNTILVCDVEANNLTLHIVHLNEEKLSEYVHSQN